MSGIDNLQLFLWRCNRVSIGSVFPHIIRSGAILLCRRYRRAILFSGGSAIRFIGPAGYICGSGHLGRLCRGHLQPQLCFADLFNGMILVLHNHVFIDCIVDVVC
jgi:hypothetical protein